MTAETTCEGLPVYPDAREISHRHVSLRDGGGGVDVHFTTDDPLEKVVEFYERQVGPGETDANLRETKWFFPETKPGLKGGRLIVVKHGPMKVGSTGGDSQTTIYIGRRHAKNE